MSLIAEFSVPPDSFALAETIEEFQDLIVELERVVPADGSPMPYLWMSETDTDSFSEALEGDASVDEITILDELGNDQLYRIQWTENEDSLIGGFATGKKTILQAETKNGGWFLKLRFDSRASLSKFQAYCEEQEIETTLKRLYALEGPKLGQFNLTPPQRKALETALDMGYFEIPRMATMAEIADELGVTANAVSERLRRAQTNLITNSMTVGTPSAFGN